ncbi:MAG: thioredoxin family protein [Calditrichaeota bacterium]|nr:MAG: thioredoxin family protein [Calditrichota bacterium]
MKKFLHFGLITLLILCSSFSVFAEEMAKPEIGKQAPNFELMGADGKAYNLADFKGKFVVLEWINFDCPFVKKQYQKSGKMPSLQQQFTEKGVVWLSICSSAEDKQGNFSRDVLEARMKAEKHSATAYLLDADGKVGKMYDAKTTPHMFVINPKGELAYMGAIDSIRSTDPEDIPKAKNYVSDALNALLSGKEVEKKVSKPYGCSVKY